MNFSSRTQDLIKSKLVDSSVFQRAWVVILVVVGVSFEGQVWGVVTDSHQKDDDGAERHHRSDEEEAEPVHRPGDPAPVVLLLRQQRTS